MVQKAEWDSNFFGFPVGKVNLKSVDNFEEVILASEKFKLVYVFSDVEINEPSLDLVDKKIIYKKALEANKEINPVEGNGDLTSFDPKIHSYDHLLELAHLSGTYSRFKLDSNIPGSRFLEMYKLWLDNSINKKIAFETLVSITEGNISGFVTLGKKDSDCSQIGLIAVNGDYQGRSIGSRLISECEILSQGKGFSSIEVTTQGENKAACGLYEKNNFNIKSAQYIYHLWNK
ncbi:GNAT family N-acetyltransferase [Autumnicola psychrophila]|uniref:GNAT family N-acetyltransferase n=1 Tax=Autumnicola psychrophila TaxID=3075592 RepID=A0ABU3DS77_9FLAO|nr:GNAT family N-acetyltransferase [Zunongwangia sp. F225]MDT0686581.1 GNAT family N-acetyltransferase [Zunongwangia sp. F225]